MSQSMTIAQGVQSLKDFLLANVPDGTTVEVTQAQADDLSRVVDNIIALKIGNWPLDVDAEDDVVNVVGWLVIEVRSWFHESGFEDHLLDVWAAETRADDEVSDAVVALIEQVLGVRRAAEDLIREMQL